MQGMHFGIQILSVAERIASFDFGNGRSDKARAVQMPIKDVPLHTQSTTQLFRSFIVGSFEVIATLLRLPRAGRLQDGMRRIISLENADLAACESIRTAEVNRVFDA